MEHPIKVIYVYDDKIRYVVGDDANFFSKTYNDMCMLAQNRNQNPYVNKTLNWFEETITKGDDNINSIIERVKNHET